MVAEHGKTGFRMIAADEPGRRPLPGTITEFTDEEKLSLDGYDWFAPDEEVERLFG